MPDPVNHPSHYTDGGIEAIDYIAAKLGDEGFRAYCLGNVLKYVSRWRHKDGEQDLKKAAVYLGWAIKGAPERLPEAGNLCDLPAHIQALADRIEAKSDSVGDEVPGPMCRTAAQALHDSVNCPDCE